MKYWFYIGLLLLTCNTQAQNIRMEFPAFAGKTYDFIIFQGDQQVIAQQDTIPQGGEFVLTIPKKHSPYTGMSRWLITGTKDGGGLDMSIPGKDFSISCIESTPNENNIIYKGYDPVKSLNGLLNEQKQIINKYEVMNKATQLYESKHPLYQTFEKERQYQALLYNAFQSRLEKNTDYAARFLPIINIVNGIAPKLVKNEDAKFKEIARYFAHDLDINSFYTSGHWSGIIGSWVQIHMHVIKDDKVLYEQFKTLSNRISSSKLYTDLTGKVTYYMKSYGMEKQIDLIAPIVTNSGKVTEYVGTMEVYIKALTGTQGPDLAITEHIGKLEDHNHKSTILKSSELAMGNYTQTLLVFYQSGCGPCEALMQTLPGKYPILKDKGIRLISISADESEQVFKNSSDSYPWVDKYCDFEGKNGLNFKNYAVKGTPTLVLLDKKGAIVQKAATLEEILRFNKIEK